MPLLSDVYGHIHNVSALTSIRNDAQESPIRTRSTDTGTGLPPGAPEQDPALGKLQKVIDVLERLDHRYRSQDLQLRLHHAVCGGNLQLVRYLFERGDTVDRMVAYCAIQTEVEREMIPLSELMLEHEWDVNGALHSSYTALWGVGLLAMKLI